MKIKIISIILILSILSCQSNNNKNLHSETILQTGWYFISDTPTLYKRQLAIGKESYYLVPTPIITVNNFKTNNLFHEKDCYAMITWLDSTGSLALYAAKQNVEYKILAFILNDSLLRIQSIDDPQFAKVEKNIDQRTYGQLLAFPCNSRTESELKRIKILMESKRTN